MNRFWKEVHAENGQVLLDGRPLRTPSRTELDMPPALAEAVAAEWRQVSDQVDPRAMPITGLANAAIDRVRADRQGFVASIARYGESDLLCYRAQTPPELVARQHGLWDPLLEWARQRYDVAFNVTAGIVHVAQPPATLSRLARAVNACSDFQLAAMSSLVTIGGSLVIPLMIFEEAIEPEAAFDACHLDELWQAELWGEDPLAALPRAQRRHDFLSAASFLALLRASA